MPEKTIAVPTARSLGDAFKDFGVGALGGLIFLLASQVFGGLGVIAAPLISASMLKGDRGKIIATISGFMLLAMTALAVKPSGGANEGVM